MGVLADQPSGSGLAPVLGEYGPPVIGHSFSFISDTLNPRIEQGLGAWRPASDFRLYTLVKQLTLDLAADVPGGIWHRGLVGRRYLENYFRAALPAKRRGDGQDLFSVLCRAEGDVADVRPGRAGVPAGDAWHLDPGTLCPGRRADRARPLSHAADVAVVE
jgi:hypothetical protein